MSHKSDWLGALEREAPKMGTPLDSASVVRMAQGLFAVHKTMNAGRGQVTFQHHDFAMAALPAAESHILAAIGTAPTAEAAASHLRMALALLEFLANDIQGQ